MPTFVKVWLMTTSWPSPFAPETKGPWVYSHMMVSPVLTDNEMSVVSPEQMVEVWGVATIVGSGEMEMLKVPASIGLHEPT